MSCRSVGGVTLCTGPEPARVDRESASVRWCWRCREHRVFLLTLTEYGPNSYYDPEWTLRCDRCDRDWSDMMGSRLGRWSDEDNQAHRRIITRFGVDGAEVTPDA